MWLCDFISIVVHQKNIVYFFWLKIDANQQKHMKKSKLKFDRKSCQYDDNCSNNYYFRDSTCYFIDSTATVIKAIIKNNNNDTNDNKNTNNTSTNNSDNN